MQHSQFYPKSTSGDTVFIAYTSKKRTICITVY